jgi:hypothetical protein
MKNTESRSKMMNPRMKLLLATGTLVMGAATPALGEDFPAPPTARPYALYNTENGGGGAGGLSTASPSAGPEGYLWLYGGLDAGPMEVSTSAVGEKDQSGQQLRPKLLVSYYLNEKWAFDGGLGWTRFSVDTEDKSTTVATRAGFVELSPKWRPTERWQLGLLADFYFGTDLSFAASYQTPGVAVFGGVQAAYDLSVASKWRLRLAAMLLTDVNVTERQIYAGMAGLQIGLPIDKLK